MPTLLLSFRFQYSDIAWRYISSTALLFRSHRPGIFFHIRITKRVQGRRIKYGSFPATAKCHIYHYLEKGWLPERQADEEIRREIKASYLFRTLILAGNKFCVLHLGISSRGVIGKLEPCSTSSYRQITCNHLLRGVSAGEVFLRNRRLMILRQRDFAPFQAKDSPIPSADARQCRIARMPPGQYQ